MTAKLRRAGLIVGAAGFLSLVTNRAPVITVILFGLAAVLSLRKPDRIGIGVLVVWVFWVASFALTTESWKEVFLSFAFHRRDGQIFFSLLPILIFAGLARNARVVAWVGGVFCAAQAVVALFGLSAHLFHVERDLLGFVYLWDEGPNVQGPAFTALYLAHNAGGSVLGLCCLAATTLAALGPPGRGRWFWGTTAGVLLWGLIISKSRGSMLSLGGALVILSVLVVRRKGVSRKGLLAAGGVLGLTAVFLGPIIVHRFDQFRGNSGTHTGRMQLAKRAFEEWKESPIVGEGMGRYNDEKREWSGRKGLYYRVTRAKVVNDASHAHNSYMHFLAEGGAIGLLLTVGFWGWAAWKLRKSREPLRVAAFLGVLYLFAIAFTEHYMGGGVMLLTLSSLVGAAWSLPEEPAPDKIAAP